MSADTAEHTEAPGEQTGKDILPSSWCTDGVWSLESCRFGHCSYLWGTSLFNLMLTWRQQLIKISLN